MGMRRVKPRGWAAIPRAVLVAMANVNAVKVIEGFGGKFSRVHGCWIITKQDIEDSGSEVTFGFARVRALCEGAGAVVTWIL